MENIKKILLITCGTLSVVMGVLGMFFPVLPTTPFLLLAAFCYARSSERFYHWLITNRLFGEYIKNYREGKGIPLKQKIIALTFLWLTMGYTVLFVVPLWWVKLLLLGIATGVTVHLVRLKTLKLETRHPSVPAERNLPEESV